MVHNHEQKIAIQGGHASFHDMAARQYFASQSMEIFECRTFRQVFNALIEKQVDRAVMAIENTLVGSILPNYSLLQEYPVCIIGEMYFHVQQNLMALPGQSLSDIRSVRSHPMALLQCSEFLERYPNLRALETFDTADSAKNIFENQLKGVAAVASHSAAELYGLNILAREIENLKKNYTRFLILSREEEKNGLIADKASINFHVSHRVGALVEILNVFKQHAINLTLIQSIPLLGRPYEYSIHVDVEWQHKHDFDVAIQQAIVLAKKLKILGIYKSGEKPFDNTSRSSA